MSNTVDPVSVNPQFDPGHDEGVVQAAMNVAAAHVLSGHLLAAIEWLISTGRFVPPSLIAFAEQLAEATRKAAAVLEGTGQPTEPGSVDEVRPSSAAFFSVSVAEDGLVDLECTTKMSYLVSRILREYRDWRHDQGFALPPVVGAFGGAMGNLSRIARPVVLSRPVVRLPDEPTGRPLARFWRPQAS